MWLQFRMSAPVFLTIAAHRLSRVLLYDLVSALGAQFAADGIPMSLDDVDEAFRLVHHGGQCRIVRFQEEVSHAGVVLRAFPAGRTLGGALWTMSRLTEKVAYAHDMASTTGACLPGCALNAPASSSSLRSPSRSASMARSG